MTRKFNLPDELDELKLALLRVLDPIKQISEQTVAAEKFLFNAQRTDAGRHLPEYYLCYFLFVELLEFKNLGKFEKIAWSVPIDYQGVAFLIEHRKMGLGLFAHDAKSQAEESKEIVKKISKAVSLARPYFEWRAHEAAKQSKLNVTNHHRRLFDKFQYFTSKFKRVSQEAEERSGERIETKYGSGISVSFPAFELRRNAEWIALAALDSFFSWTEHVFILCAILTGKITTGEEVANLADNDWAIKFKSAINIKNEVSRDFYNKLVVIKRQLRNYMAHGAFGKNGEAFSFHSGAGAVPLLMPHQKGSGRFSFSDDLSFDEKEVISLIEKFIEHFWSGELKPAKFYVESDLPLILTMAHDGTFSSAMESVENMEEFVEHLIYQSDQAANMDW